ncbi:hypothetical protein F442_02779 [Phytophthora nicotianae P10297]|uniref:HTH psq-type domain-containing protein n=4 Tax=Phytophthora nicotianae TaxID=4792 RepID=V9FUG1_PHYNI|nr:hypothetical protein F443_02796 [Phytophthora nicotianae P1569]ETO83115.1 hypothetical protein F444_02810 [Phytophthora nicotianae P1976]ETP52168.1 hypothetical protein F442_02779 [Phytophthora nicotianae P10297]
MTGSARLAPKSEMPSRITPYTLIEKQRVLEAHRAGREDWLAVARFNGIPVATA